MDDNIIIISSATSEDFHYAQTITTEMEASAKARGTGISKRSPESIREKMHEGKAIIAITKWGEWAGFIYMEPWQDAQFVSHCGLIVAPKWRRMGIATAMKVKIFELTRQKYPAAKIFGITTTLATMKINSKLGLEPVTFSEITHEETFWNKCKSCVHYSTLKDANYKNCFCTAMLFNPQNEKSKTELLKHSCKDLSLTVS